ncbi:MAG: hypothetical protein OXU62_04540 [Gammaproteobacteria bacterium]|nr:hypothetical protein [Gammaproteobacteria bacterium]
MIPEAKLTKVEQGVLAAFRADGLDIDVVGAEIRGEFLRGLFLGGYDEKADYRGTYIVNANIIDTLEMEFCETKFPVRFRACCFAKEICFQQLTCPELDFSGCTLKNGFDARMVKVAGGVDMKEVDATAIVSFAGAEVGGQIECAGGIFHKKEGGALSAQGIRVASDVLLNDGFKAVGEVNLLGADIKGQLNCAGGIFRNKGSIALNAQSMKVASSVFLSAGDSDGEHAKTFMAEGGVDLAGAEIGGQLNCEGGIFRNERDIAINAQGIKVTDGMYMRKGFDAKGAVYLLGAEIHGQLDCRGGCFHDKGGFALIAQGIKVASDVLLIPHPTEGRDEDEIFSANGWVSFLNATIGGNLMLHNCKLTHLSLKGTNVLGEFRDDANIYKDQNGNDIVLDIDGFRYHRLNVAKEREKDRLEWVGLMSKVDRFYPQPYEQLMKVYREMGHMNLARKVGFELEKKRHKQLRLNRDHKRFVVLGWAWWMWCWILRATIGYGYKPFRTLWWFPFAIVVGLPLFSGVLCPQKWTSPSVVMSTLGNGITEQSECERWRMLPSDVGALVSPEWRDGEVPPEGYPKFIPLFYAIEVALPVLALGQTSNWQPESLGLKWIQGIFIIIGAVALAIPASYRTGFLNPRWWD